VKPFPARKPVFVDSSGHRHRKIRRLGLVVAVPAVGYLVLLASSVLGGPQVDTPLIPLPEAAKQQPAPKVKTTQQPVDTPEPGDEVSTPETTVRPVTEDSDTPSPGEFPTSTPASSAPTVAPPTTGTSATPTTSTSTRTTPSTTPPVTPVTPGGTPGHGKPTTEPPGQTKTPGKP
jgi:hypothetical protein